MTTKLLDATAKQPVAYCIPYALRDAQIAIATKRIQKRIAPLDPPPTTPIAIACFGPSLNDTWEQLREFPVVMSCSGAHKFLVDRGVIPTYHVEVDPRAHKVKLIGPPQAGTKYLIASTCHPAVFDHLEGYDVALWHVFDSTEEGIRALPHGDAALHGGCSVGVRTLTMAGFLGFRDLHVFGMDGSQGATGKHAAEHPNQPPGHSLTEYPPGSGQMWETTVSMLEAARGTWHELNQLGPKVTATFYGHGLVQEMAKHYVPAYTQGVMEGITAFVRPPLISEAYRALNAQLHRDRPDYGIRGGQHADMVKKIKEKIGAKRVLDYGCGKGELAKALDFPIWEYDPAIPEKSASPRPADLVVATDVLEHIEPEMLDAVLADLARVVRDIGLFTIHTGPAMKVLADGRNAHLIQQDAAWWLDMLRRYFTVGKPTKRGREITVIVGPKKVKKKA